MKRNILFVDDEQAILDGIRTMMHAKRKEWKCHYANSGAEGLQMLGKKKFDVVVADMRMPGMDGADFLTEVAEREPGAIRIILSGYSDPVALQKVTRVAHQFLSKPCSSDVIIKTIQRVTDLSEILSNDEVRTVVARVNSLPVMPDLYIQLKKELEAPEPDIKLIGSLVEKDVGVTATLLKVVNSSFFGFYGKVTSPARAVALLGTEIVKGLVLGALFLSKIDMAAFTDYSVSKLWDHSMQTGYFAKTIAAMESEDKDFIDECFLSGILHDVGKLIFVTKMNEIYDPVLSCVRSKGGPVGLCELEMLGVGHAEVGAYLLGLWGFNSSVVTGVNWHHSPEKAEKGVTHSLVCHVANTLQHEIMNYSKEYSFSTINVDYLSEIGLEDRLDVWRDACKEKWSEHEE